MKSLHLGNKTKIILVLRSLNRDLKEKLHFLHGLVDLISLSEKMQCLVNYYVICFYISTIINGYCTGFC